MPAPDHRHGPLDALRGLVIVLMTLDHVRGFCTPAGASPTDLEATTLGFFFMRWVTHLCAPAFVFLMGAAAALRQDKRPDDMVRFLVTRGLVLIAFELTWVSFSWSWDPSYHYLGVLWALGASMLLLAPFVRAPRAALLALGLVGTVGLAAAAIESGTPGTGFWLHPGSLVVLGAKGRAYYAAVPGLLVAAVGWGTARWLVQTRGAVLAAVGAGAVATGLGLRILGVGNPRPWTVWDDPLRTALDVLHLDKYPPSLDFLLVFVGGSLALLALAKARRGWLLEWLQDLGRVPMFFYLVHLPLAHLAGNAVALAWFGTPRIPAAEPVRLWLVLAVWAGVVAVLTPACRAWGRLKAQRRDLWWLAYL